MMSPDGSAKAATGHNRIAIANEHNPKHARARIRRELNDILYPGALTSRLKRYAAEPAPDGTIWRQLVNELQTQPRNPVSGEGRLGSGADEIVVAARRSQCLS